MKPAGTPGKLGRRTFLKKLAATLPSAAGLTALMSPTALLARAVEAAKSLYNPADHYYGMGIQIDKCIGCGKCVEACKVENGVLDEPYFYRTWVERYIEDSAGNVSVDSPGGGRNGFPALGEEKDIMKSFFVPKLCNHCENPPCVQVCPVGATFVSEDGVVLIDKDYCIGCRYCIQACPYGARYLDPRTKTADKCTFCYHRVTRGLLPACVEVCPTQARVFGDIRKQSSPLHRLRRLARLQVLKPYLNTKPKVFYTNLDGEVN